MITLEMVWMTGILAGIFFFLNFATCFSMPWSKKCFSPHKCKGDKCSEGGSLCQHHKPLAWLTILTGVLHIVVSVLWYIGY